MARLLTSAALEDTRVVGCGPPLFPFDSRSTQSRRGEAAVPRLATDLPDGCEIGICDGDGDGGDTRMVATLLQRQSQPGCTRTAPPRIRMAAGTFQKATQTTGPPATATATGLRNSDSNCGNRGAGHQ